MKNRVVTTSGVRFPGRRSAFILAVLFCLLFNAPHALAQETKTLSEKPLINQVFDPATNQTEVRVILKSNSFSAETGKRSLGGITLTFYAPRQFARVQSGLVLGYASHVYDGRTLTGSQRAKFTFYSKRKDTFKDPPAFSISIDGQAIHEGVAEPPVQLASDGDYRQKIIVSVPTAVFLLTARAKKVEFKLGPKTYKLEGYQQKSILALANIIDPQSK